MAWTSIQKMMPGKIKALGLEKEVEFFNLKGSWDEIIVSSAGKIFQNKTKPLGLKKEILFIDCLNSVWANELRFKEEDLLKAIRAKLKRTSIKKVMFVN